jgi:hypothetical protein
MEERTMPAPQGGRSGVSQPLHGFFVVLMTAMIAGAWLYFDATVRELRGQINQVQAEVRGGEGDAEDGKDGDGGSEACG